MAIKIKFLITGTLAMLIVACTQNDPASSENDLQVSAIVEQQATLGWEVNDIVATTQDIEDFTLENSILPQDDISGTSPLSTMRIQAVDIMRVSQEQIPMQLFLAKPQADTMLFYYDDVGKGVRSAIYYDGSTSLVRAYEVKYKFGAWQKMIYDSVSIVFNANFTPDDNSDDMLDSVHRTQQFQTDFFVRQIVSDLQVTDFSGQEITAFTATVDSYYHPDRFLVHKKQSIAMAADESGTLREDFEFKDGKTSYHSVTFYPNHTGVFARQLRDGTMVHGTFNDVWDDLSGSFTELIDFPEGRYVDKISKAATVALVLPDSIFYAELSRAVYFSNGKVDSTHIGLQVQKISGVKTTLIDASKANGAHGTFVVEEYDDMAYLNGQWVTWNNYVVLVNADYYSDGSAHIYYEVYEPPYTEGDTPIITAEYFISPDGSGNGTITEGEEKYDVNFEGSDQVTISQGAKRRMINLYH